MLRDLSGQRERADVAERGLADAQHVTAGLRAACEGLRRDKSRLKEELEGARREVARLTEESTQLMFELQHCEGALSRALGRVREAEERSQELEQEVCSPTAESCCPSSCQGFWTEE